LPLLAAVLRDIAILPIVLCAAKESWLHLTLMNSNNNKIKVPYEAHTDAHRRIMLVTALPVP
jgi:hypothetical protein